MPRSWWLLSAAVLVSCNGCTQAPVEHTVRKVTTEDVRRDTEKAVDTATRAAAQSKEDFETRLKARWKEKMADLEAKQKIASEKLDEVRTSTGEAWGHLEKGAQAAWEDVRKALQEAAKEF